jgi:hypothetical protein
MDLRRQCTYPPFRHLAFSAANGCLCVPGVPGVGVLLLENERRYLPYEEWRRTRNEEEEIQCMDEESQAGRDAYVYMTIRAYQIRREIA